MVPALRRFSRRLPDSRQLARLEIAERAPSGRAKLYRGPITQQTFTQYRVQQAKNFSLSPSEVAEAKRTKVGQETGWEIIQRAHKRHEHLPELLTRAQQKTGKSRGKLIKSPEFFQQVANLASGPRKGTKRGKALHFFGYVPTPVKYVRRFPQVQ